MQKELIKDTQDSKDILLKSQIKVIKEVKSNEHIQIYYTPVDKNLISRSLVPLIDEEMEGKPRIGDLKENNGFIDWDDVFAVHQFTPAYEKPCYFNNDEPSFLTPGLYDTYEIMSQKNKPMSDMNSRVDITSRVEINSRIDAHYNRFKHNNKLPGVPLSFINLNEDTPRSPRAGGFEEPINTSLNESFAIEKVESLRRDLKPSASVYNYINIYNNYNLDGIENDNQTNKILTEVRRCSFNF
jgi:hypothetical protein